jgi:hypothetical protein
MAGIVFTLLAFSSMRGYYYIQTCLSFIGFVAAWFLIEPKIHIARNKVSLRAIIEIVRDTLWKYPQLSRYILLSSIIGFASLSMAWFAQIFLFDAGVEKANFGIFWTALNLMVTLGSFSATRIDKLFGPKYVLVFLLVFLSGGYILAGQTISLWGIGFLMIFYFVRGTAHPIMKDRINKLTSSDVRATVLSVRSLVIRILFAVLGPLMGWLTDHISLTYALTLCGIIILLPGIYLVTSILRSQK